MVLRSISFCTGGIQHVEELARLYTCLGICPCRCLYTCHISHATYHMSVHMSIHACESYGLPHITSLYTSMNKCLYLCQYTYLYILTIIEMSVCTLYACMCTCLYTCHNKHCGGKLSGKGDQLLLLKNKMRTLMGFKPRSPRSFTNRDRSASSRSSMVSAPCSTNLCVDMCRHVCRHVRRHVWSV